MAQLVVLLQEYRILKDWLETINVISPFKIKPSTQLCYYHIVNI